MTCSGLALSHHRWPLCLRQRLWAVNAISLAAVAIVLFNKSLRHIAGFEGMSSNIEVDCSIEQTKAGPPTTLKNVLSLFCCVTLVSAHCVSGQPGQFQLGLLLDALLSS